MSNQKQIIKGHLIEIPIKEAGSIIAQAIFSDSSLQLKGRITSLENQYQNGTLTNEEYSIRTVKLREAINHLIENLNESDLRKLSVLFQNTYVPKFDGKISLLFIASSPLNVSRLEVDMEYAQIKTTLMASIYKDRYNLTLPIFACTIDSMVDEINIVSPTIIHFAGHAGKKGIIFNDENNDARIIPTNILEKFFKSFGHKIDCVFLNACYSAEQAKVISNYADYVIGMNCAIGDQTAIDFSVSFYRSLFNIDNQNYERAYQQALVKLELNSKDEVDTPNIWKKGVILE